MNSASKFIPLYRSLHSKWTSSLWVSCRRQSLPCLSTWSSDSEGGRRRWRNVTILASLGVAGLAFLEVKKFRLHAKEAPKTSADKDAESLPTYSAQDVATHDNKEKRIWVSFGHGVYDITDFVDEHPGGDKILLGAGGAIEPFWNLYGVHKSPEILALLETFRIGNLKSTDVGEAMKGTSDPYATDPKRHPVLKPASMRPFNAEPPVSILTDSYITPSEFFYVRNHLPVPEVDLAEYQLELVGLDGEEHTLTLDDLKTKFPKVTVTSVVQCAGNRRSELNKVKKVKGLDWGACAIGNATWSGARLVDVLKYYRFNLDDPRIQHVIFDGLDLDPTGVSYGASILADKALDPKGDVILAYEMNGEPLPRDHGFPVRAIVPGVVGARNVKWLGRIQLSEVESDSHWQKGDYKGFCPSVDWDTVDFDSAPAIEELPVTSAVCSPPDGSTVRGQTLHVKGYAWSGGGRKIVRVDVSSDGGRTWKAAKLQSEDTSLTRAWAWTLWEIDVPIPEGAEKLEIVSKAVDSSYNTQPDTTENIWNLRGVLNNAWHRVTYKVAHS